MGRAKKESNNAEFVHGSYVFLDEAVRKQHGNLYVYEQGHSRISADLHVIDAEHFHTIAGQQITSSESLKVRLALQFFKFAVTLSKHASMSLQAITLGHHAGLPDELRQAQKPPKAAKYLLLLVPGRFREGLVGDLEEEFTTILVPEFGPRAAKIYYWWHVLLACAYAARSLLYAVTKWLLRSS
ncbi:hypothetical protein [Terriglobus aquaticus]|uniref:Uncharacterized protein n=1 Tax=Terriglobus aquaticus TaxID=940139 RepID=A0ABW9KI79_9BACT|nr:hypothetical protein [Terriglobus aquaticus]